MGMHVAFKRLYWLTCDKCGARSHEVGRAVHDDHQAIREAVAEGWHQTNDCLYYYCPPCAVTLEVCS